MTREVTTFDLGEIAKKCQEKLAIEIEKKKQNVECYVTADVPPIEADKNGIERVILNVLSNAVKYTQEEGIIKIYVGFVYNDAYIKVIDNGNPRIKTYHINLHSHLHPRTWFADQQCGQHNTDQNDNNLQKPGG